MKMLKLIGIDNPIVLNSGDIINICIENIDLYFKIVNSFINVDNENIVYSEDYVIKSFDKYSIVITDAFNVDINNKKILSALYKTIDKNKNNIGIKERIDEVNYKILNILDDISLDMNCEMDYVDELDLCKLLNLYNFSFINDNSVSLCERLVRYIKANTEISNISFVIFCDIIKFLNDKEKEMVKKEMSYLGISIINISYNNSNRNYEKIIVIDDDLCEF